MAAATGKAARAREEADEARQKTIWLESPLHPRNLSRWAQVRGPRVLLAGVATIALLMLARVLARSASRLMVRPGRRRKGGAKRADTLALSFSSATG